MAKKMRLGLIGLGRWGSNYLACLLKMQNVESIIVACRQNQIENSQIHQKIIYKTDWKEVCRNTTLDGVIIASSPESHYEITKYALNRGQPVLVEKPFTLCANQTEELNEISIQKDTLCMVGYTHIYSSGYQDLKLNIEKIGKIKKIYSEGLSVGPYRRNIPVLWDWGSHDIAMCIDLLNETPISTKIIRILNSTDKQSSEILEIRMLFESKIEARCIIGNASHFKRRDFYVVCEQGSILYDGLSPGLAKQYYESENYKDGYRFESHLTPLESVINEFLYSIQVGKKYHYTLGLAKRVNNTLSKINFN